MNVSDLIDERAQSSQSGSLRLPNFLLIGAAKSGTTSLSGYLVQHPEVFVSRLKEPNYFALAGQPLPCQGPAPPEVIRRILHHHSITDFARYQELFGDASQERAVGEASVRYLYFEQAAQRISDTLTDPCLIAILREPVGRMYSHYCMNVEYQLEPLEFTAAVAAEADRKELGWGWDWHYASVGAYANQLRRYYELFEADRIKIFLYDEFVAEPVRVYREICRCLGISQEFTPDMSKRGKVASRPIHAGLDRWLQWPSESRQRLESLLPRGVRRPLLKRIAQWNRRPAPPLDPGLRTEMKEIFRDDIGELEQLLGRRTGWIDW